jgi:hypothetical protein
VYAPKLSTCRKARIKRRRATNEVSTVAAQQSRNFSQPQVTIDLDLRDRSSWYCMLDEAVEMVLEQKLGIRQAMREVFSRMPRSRIAPETGIIRRGLAVCRASWATK